MLKVRKLFKSLDENKMIKVFLFTVNNNKRKRDCFKHGNYQNYYYKRLKAGEQETDIRLSIFEEHSEYFKGKSLLDIGCNSGFITINVAKKLKPASTLGIDIDEKLVNQARQNLEKEKEDFKLSKQERVALDHVAFRRVI